LKDLTDMKPSVVFGSSAWIEWRQKYLNANPGELPDIKKVLSFADKNLALAKKSLERQTNTLDEIKKLWGNDSLDYGAR
jgi:hypothetical protein